MLIFNVLLLINKEQLHTGGGRGDETTLTFVL